MGIPGFTGYRLVYGFSHLENRMQGLHLGFVRLKRTNQTHTCSIMGVVPVEAGNRPDYDIPEPWTEVTRGLFHLEPWSLCYDGLP